MSTLTRFGLAAALLFWSGLVRAGSPPANNADGDVVTLTGWLHVEDHTWQDALVHIEVDGTTQVARVSETGRFDLRLPANTEVVLRFEKPGHLPKEVVVDTHHARDGDPGKHRRHVKFAVILELERHMAGFTYHSPVGTIGFEQGGGCVAVAHKRDKVPPSRNKPMVF
ncbi:MAG: hypothetical protein IPM46_05265 [Flavobacteriales bacterium]|nr:hypothetical protein [Flavobacteriales bacterium]